MSENQNHSGSVFDAESFLSMTMTDSLSTERPKIDEGEYQGYVKKISIRNGQDKNGRGYMVLDADLTVDDEGQKQKTNLPEPTVRYSAFLDTVNGNLDTSEGKNVDLGLLRHATGLNNPGQPFNLRMLEGKPLRFRVVNKDGYANARNVAPL
jgi:hypothetical protein